MRNVKTKAEFKHSDVAHIEEPPFARTVFGSVQWSWLWLAVRLAIGYEWIKAGWGKLHNSAWVGSDAGSVFMKMSYLLAGTVSVNPVLLMGAVLLVLAWRNAGWYGLDRWVLPALGTPWSPGYIFHIHHGSASQSHGSLTA
jgi:uncharacterized membrane protein YphA (DoxX/SURF4 family)